MFALLAMSLLAMAEPEPTADIALSAAPVRVEREVLWGRASAMDRPMRGSFAGATLRVEASAGAAPVKVRVVSVPPVAGGHPMRAGLCLAGTNGTCAPDAAVTLTIEPGRMTQVPLVLYGDLPLGTATAGLRLTGEGLAAPLDVPVDIQSRRPRAVLVGVALLGVLTNVVLKVSLPRQQRRAIAKGKLRALKERIALDLAARPSAKRLAELIAAVDAALAAKGAENQEDQYERIRAEAEAVVAAWDKEHVALATRLAPLLAVVRRAWTLPAGATRTLGAMTGAVSEARDGLACGDLAGATAALELGEREAAALQGALVRMWTSVRTTLGYLASDVPAPLPDEPATRAARQRAEGGLGRLRAALADDKLPVTLEGWLTLTHELAPVLDGTVELLVALFEGSEVEPVRAALPPKRSKEPEIALDELARALVSLAATAARLPADRLDPVALREGRYADLFAPARRGNEAAITGTRPVSGRELGVRALAVPVGAPGGVAPVVGGAELVAAPTAAEPSAIEVQRYGDLRILSLSEGLRLAISGGAVLVAAWSAYAGRFVGDIGELAAVFVFAFGADLTLDRLADLKKAGGSAG